MCNILLTIYIEICIALLLLMHKKSKNNYTKLQTN